MTMTCPPFTSPTHRRIFELLVDGRLHSEEEIGKLLYDDLYHIATIRQHFRNMRPLLNRHGFDVVPGRGQERGYRLVRLINTD